MNIVCSICARGGSKGLRGKNTRQLLGKPLIGWSIEQAYECKEISEVFVSTDDDRIAAEAINYGASVPFTRPKSLSNDQVGKWEVWQHALENFELRSGKNIDLLVDLDCTSPLRDPEDISRAIQTFFETEVDVVFSICEARKNPYFNMLEKTEKGFKHLV